MCGAAPQSVMVLFQAFIITSKLFSSPMQFLISSTRCTFGYNSYWWENCNSSASERQDSNLRKLAPKASGQPLPHIPLRSPPDSRRLRSYNASTLPAVLDETKAAGRRLPPFIRPRCAVRVLSRLILSECKLGRWLNPVAAVVREVGLEPTCLAAAEFESAVYAISNHSRGSSGESRCQS